MDQTVPINLTPYPLGDEKPFKIRLVHNNKYKIYAILDYYLFIQLIICNLMGYAFLEGLNQLCFCTRKCEFHNFLWSSFFKSLPISLLGLGRQF